MDSLDEPIDANSYRIDATNFEPVATDSTPYAKIDALLEHRERGQTPLTFRLDGPDDGWKKQVVYTVGLALSDRSHQTLPIFEITLPKYQGFEEMAMQRRDYEDGLSAYTSHLRSFFVEEDNHGRLTGLGPIGKCFSLSQQQPVILFMHGIDRVPGKAQALFFGILDRNPRVQFGAQIDGEPTNLTIFTSTDSTGEREELDMKLRRLLGSVFKQD